MVNGITFSEQLTTSADFAHFQNTFLNHSDGITKGCDISQADGNVYIQKGYFVVCGRFVRVVGVETIPTPDVLSGKLYCKVVFEVDLTKVNRPEEFRQGYFRVLSSAEKYQEATQEDLDGDGTLYQMEWCQFTKGVDGISEWRDLRPIMNLDSIWEAVSGQNQLYKGEFDTYFAGPENSHRTDDNGIGRGRICIIDRCQENHICRSSLSQLERRTPVYADRGRGRPDCRG